MEIKTMTRPEIVSLWKKTWGEELPSGRPTPAKMDTYYPITELDVGFIDDKPVSMRGYGEKGDYHFEGMHYTHPDYLNQGLNRELQNHRPISGKTIVGLSQRMADFSQEDWINTYKSKGFTINPTDEELDEVFGEDRDKKITEPFINFYRNHEKNTWAIKNTTVAKWWSVIKG